MFAPMLQRVVVPNGPVFYQSPLLTNAGVRHGFTTRLGGVSSSPFDSLNLGNPQRRTPSDPQDSAANLQVNLQRVQDAIGCGSSRRRWCRQVHGNNVAVVAEGFEDGTDADALLTADPGDVLAIRVADCVPILLSSRDGAVVAAVHAGWRGVVSEIVPRAATMIAAEANCSSSDLVAAIGPCIGFDAFEVGEDVWPIFTRMFGDDVLRPASESNKRAVDLRTSIEKQLTTMGLPRVAIDSTDRCTFLHADEFFSHRRDHGLTGRMAAMIAPRRASGQTT